MNSQKVNRAGEKSPKQFVVAGMNTCMFCFGSSAPLPLVAAMVIDLIELSVLSASVSDLEKAPCLYYEMCYSITIFTFDNITGSRGFVFALGCMSSHTSLQAN